MKMHTKTQFFVLFKPKNCSGNFGCRNSSTISLSRPNETSSETGDDDDRCYEKNVFYFDGETIAEIQENVESSSQCNELCKLASLCYFWGYDIQYKECWLKSSNSGRRHFPGRISGPKDCGKLKFNAPKYRVF